MTEDSGLLRPEPKVSLRKHNPPAPVDQPVPPPAPRVPAGWHPHPTNSGLLRYWDGSIWTEHTAPAIPAPTATIPATAPHQSQPILIQPRYMVGENRRPTTNHILHFILTVLTAGLWLPVWIIVAIVNGSKRNNYR